MIKTIKKFFLHTFIFTTIIIVYSIYSINCFFQEEYDNKKAIQQKTQKALSTLKKQKL